MIIAEEDYPALILLHRMGDANTKEEFWKRLFNLLFNNKEPDDKLPTMWAQFKAENLHRSDIRAALESLKTTSTKMREKSFAR